jgi:polygalacturonase
MTLRASCGLFGLALLALACGDNAPALGTSGVGVPVDGGGASDAAGPDKAAPDTGPHYPTTCDDIGTEPTIPPACATLLATRSAVFVAADAGIDGGVDAGADGGADGGATVRVTLDESTLDTDAIQAAINACPAGQSVRLALAPDSANNAFSSGALSMKAGVTLWIDAGVTLFASRSPRDFDAVAGKCGGNNTGNCNALINVRNVSDVGVMGAGTIDGRGGEPVIGDAAGSTWWQLERTYMGNLSAPRLIQVTNGDNFTLYQITLKNAPKFHVVIDSTDGFRVWGITINTPPDSPNTDGVDPAAAQNGVIAYSKITTGDDNVAIKGGGPGVVENLVIAHNHFGRGHGMSIGSETNGGVRNVRVCDLSLDGTQNGLRIKSDSSRGGLVQGISYSDVCMRGVRNPLVIDPTYSSSATGTRIPDYRDVLMKNVHVLGGGRLTLQGYDATRLLSLTLDNVVLDTAPSLIDASNANITLGPGPVSFMPSGTGVNVTNMVSSTDAPRPCDDAWVTF